MKMLKIFLITFVSFSFLARNNSYTKRELNIDWKMKIISGPNEAQALLNR